MATFTVSEAALFLNTYPSQRLNAFNTLINRTKDWNAASSSLSALIATNASNSAITAQQQTVNAARTSLNEATEALRALNISRTNAQGVINTTQNILPSLTPATNPLVGPTGPVGDKGDKGDRGERGLQGPQGNAGNSGGQGQRGLQGDPGPTGPQGLQGVQGNGGPTGPVAPPAGSLGSLQVNGGGAGASGITPSATVGSVLVSRGTGAIPAYTQAFPVTLTGISVPSALSFDLMVGDNSLYTVPTGKRFLLNGVSVSNSTGSTITIIQTVRVGSTTTRLLTLGALATGTTVTTYQYTMIFEPGDFVGFNTNVAGLYVRLRGFLFDSGCPLRSVRKLDSWTSGDNVIYTVPTGVSAMSVGYVPFLQDSLSFRGVYQNSSGATISNLRIYIRPSGQAVQARYSITSSINTSSVGNNNLLTIGNNFVLAAGDSVLVNTTSTGSQAFILNILEFAS